MIGIYGSKSQFLQDIVQGKRFSLGQFILWMISRSCTSSNTLRLLKYFSGDQYTWYSNQCIYWVWPSPDHKNFRIQTI